MDMRFILFRSFRASKQTNWNEDDTITAPTATAISQNKVRSNDRSLDQFRPAKFQFMRITYFAYIKYVQCAYITNICIASATECYKQKNVMTCVILSREDSNMTNL